MKVALLSQADIRGGGGFIAAYRLNQALQRSFIDSRMLVNVKYSNDNTVLEPSSRLIREINRFRKLFSSVSRQMIKPRGKGSCSLGLFPSFWSKSLNNSDYDVVNLHWINSEMISISDIGRIRKPIVWTLHDMWAFCGIEHYANDERWKGSYQDFDGSSGFFNIDIDHWVWRKKLRHWRNPIHIITPSKWLAECVKESSLMHDWPVDVIPNPLVDVDLWQPIDKTLARKVLGLPLDIPIVLFGANGGIGDQRKGFDLLLESLESLMHDIKDIHLMVFGQSALPDNKFGFPVHFTGQLYDELSLRLVYSAADLFVLPSRQDNLPNTGLEAFACSTPVVSFNTCGLSDIVDHHETGYLAEPFDPEDLANGICWSLNNFEKLDSMGKAARLKAEEHWSYKAVAEKYISVYKRVIDFS